MKDRLIELIQQSVKGCARNWVEIIADYLLANGVIVLPCKVGDIVYCIDHILKITEKCKVFGYQFVNGKMQLLVDNGECKFVTLNWYNTKEEAEQALKERKQA